MEFEEASPVRSKIITDNKMLEQVSNLSILGVFDLWWKWYGRNDKKISKNLRYSFKNIKKESQ